MKTLSSISFIVVLIVTALMLIYAYGYEANKPETIETDKFILYVPSGIDKDQKYPLVIGFSPDANANGIIELWRDIAEKHNLIIAASKEFRNGIDPGNAFSTMVALICQSDSRYSIDKSRVITSGLSGGGMAAHMFSVSYPDLTWAVISNCGRIHPDYIEKERHLYARNKLVVFLASTSDFNYAHMENDRKFLEGLGWSVKWIEFQGGHSVAPKESYEQAIEWLESQM